MNFKNLVTVSLTSLLLAGIASAQFSKAPGTSVSTRQLFTSPFDVIEVDLAGRTLGAFPGFSFVQSFYEGTPVEISLDLASNPNLTGGSFEGYVVAHKTPAQWAAQNLLVDERGGSQTINWVGGTLAANAVTIDTGLLSGDAGLALGVGYDIVIDVDGNGRLSDGDLIDGYSQEAGFYVVRDPAERGPLLVTESDVFVTGVKAGFEGENLFYPQTISSMGQLPLVVISHGNGHNYNWYDHLGVHFASWGFVVMSHRNDTVPGIETASQTTLEHTDAFLGSLDTLDGGILDGHVDASQIIWIGHSRGAEGIVRAYDKIVDGFYVPTNYVIDAIKGLSSIAPTIFLSKDDTNPHDVPFHLWVGAADADVSGCASSSVVYSFLTHERATEDRFSTYLHGAGHGAFHNGTGSLVASGPCQLNRRGTHDAMKMTLIPLIHHYLYGAPAADEFLWRQDEEFVPPVPTVDPCYVLNKTYQRRSQRRVVIDNFQTSNTLIESSSGGQVILDVDTPFEGVMDDSNTNFTHSGAEPMNGMLYSIGTENSRGMVFGWSADGQSIEWEVLGTDSDFTGYKWLSFRASQVTRDPNTIAVLGDLTFDVELRDDLGNVSAINIGAYGGGVEEPYQRTSCGTGVGWSNFFETIRISLTDFQTDGRPIDLSRIEAVRLVFGSSSGSALGRMGIDDLELTNE
ncbi:MAG: hypothetical protein ACI8TQ_001139 [Planctomycetota bacterium]|jgi:hypothetical protein